MRKSGAQRPALHKIGEEMKQWSAMLADELLTWPQVTVRPMFGMLAFYRGRRIFAALPRTRALGSPGAVIFKLPRKGDRVEKELRLQLGVERNRMAKAGWLSVELRQAADLNLALRWFERAYRAAR